MNPHIFSKLMASLALLCASSFCVVFSSAVLAQSVSISEIGSGTLDHDRVEGPRWQNIEFNPLLSGSHTIGVAFIGDANIRFSVTNIDTGSVIARNKDDEWTGNLNSSDSYLIRIWSASGVADFTATIEGETIIEVSGLEIITQPSDTTVPEGNDAVLSVTASASKPLSYQWFVDDVAIDGANSSNLLISPALFTNEGAQYFVQISDGIDTISSDYATLTVASIVEPTTATIIDQGTLDFDRDIAPSFQRINFNSLGAALQTITVSWDSDADLRYNVFDSAGTRLNEERIEGANPGVWAGNLNADGQYWIALWSSEGIANFTASISIDAGVQEQPEPVPLAISEHPSDIAVIEGNEAVFSISASGSDPLSYQWFASATETDVATGNLIIYPAEPIEGATGETLVLYQATLADNESTYFVSITDSNSNTATSNSALLIVDAAPATVVPDDEPMNPAVPDNEPANTDLPDDNPISVASIGQGTLDSDRDVAPSFVRLNFDSLATALHNVTVSWDSDADLRFNVFDSAGRRLNSERVDGANPAIWSGELNANEQYSVALWSSDGIADFVARVSVGAEETESVPLIINSQPSELTVNQGDEAGFSVSASGAGPLTYQWFADDIAITGETGPNLVISMASALDNGARYSVQISDSATSLLSESAILTVVSGVESNTIIPVTLVNIGLGTLDSDKNVGPSSTQLNFDSFGAVLHTLTVSWDSDADVRFNVFDSSGTRLNNGAIQGANPLSWAGELDANEQYAVRIWSSDGIANFTASVEASIPFSITQQPIDLTVVEGENAYFSVEAAGSGQFSYQWFVNGVLLGSENTDTLTIQTSSLADTGNIYSSIVSDQSGDTINSDEATLTVTQPSSLGLYSKEADTSTWVLNGPAPTLDYNVSNANAAWGRELLRIGNVLLVGGDFNGIRPSMNGPLTNRPWLAAFDAITGEPETTFQVPSEIDTLVRALALSPDGDLVYAGGDFGLVAMDAVTGELEFMLEIADNGNAGRVFDIAVKQTHVYIGGDFTDVENSEHNNLARLSLDGEIDQSWNPNVMGGRTNGRESPVQSVAVSTTGDTIYVGGNFTGINNVGVPLSNQGTEMPFLTLDSSDGSIVRPERFGVQVAKTKAIRVRDIAVTDNYVVIAWGGPNFLTFHSLDGTKLVQYDATGDVQSLKVVGDHVFVGHHGEFFGSLENPIPPEAVESIEHEIVIAHRLHIFRVDDPSFPPENQAFETEGLFGVWGISVAEDAIWVSGQITSAGTNGHLTNGLARFPAITDQLK